MKFTSSEIMNLAKKTDQVTSMQIQFPLKPGTKLLDCLMELSSRINRKMDSAVVVISTSTGMPICGKVCKLLQDKPDQYYKQVFEETVSKDPILQENANAICKHYTLAVMPTTNSFGQPALMMSIKVVLEDKKERES